MLKCTLYCVFAPYVAIYDHYIMSESHYIVILEYEIFYYFY